MPNPTLQMLADLPLEARQLFAEILVDLGEKAGNGDGYNGRVGFSELVRQSAITLWTDEDGTERFSIVNPS